MTSSKEVEIYLDPVPSIDESIAIRVQVSDAEEGFGICQADTIRYDKDTPKLVYSLPTLTGDHRRSMAVALISETKYSGNMILHFDNNQKYIYEVILNKLGKSTTVSCEFPESSWLSKDIQLPPGFIPTTVAPLSILFEPQGVFAEREWIYPTLYDGVSQRNGNKIVTTPEYIGSPTIATWITGIPADTNDIKLRFSSRKSIPYGASTKNDVILTIIDTMEDSVEIHEQQLYFDCTKWSNMLYFDGNVTQRYNWDESGAVSESNLSTPRAPFQSGSPCEEYEWLDEIIVEGTISSVREPHKVPGYFIGVHWYHGDGSYGGLTRHYIPKGSTNFRVMFKPPFGRQAVLRKISYGRILLGGHPSNKDSPPPKKHGDFNFDYYPFHDITVGPVYGIYKRQK